MNRTGDSAEALQRLEVQDTREQCTLAGLSDDPNHPAESRESTGSEYLCYFFHRYLAFRLIDLHRNFFKKANLQCFGRQTCPAMCFFRGVERAFQTLNPRAKSKCLRVVDLSLLRLT
jgi:hypothetical protein